MIPHVIAVKALFSGKLGLVASISVISFAVLALTEAFMGQLIIALIAAVPPTGAVIVALYALLRGQKQMHQALDGKLSQLVQAETKVARAEGVQQERSEERDRVAAVPVLPAQIEIINAADNPVPVKPVELGKEKPGKKL